MKTIWFALCLVACDLPSQTDIDKSIDKTLEECRQIVVDAVPDIVGQVTANIIPACSIIATQLNDAPQQVANTVLISMGCWWDGTYWDCSNALICNAMK